MKFEELIESIKENKIITLLLLLLITSLIYIIYSSEGWFTKNITKVEEGPLPEQERKKVAIQEIIVEIAGAVKITAGRNARDQKSIAEQCGIAFESRRANPI